MRLERFVPYALIAVSAAVVQHSRASLSGPFGKVRTENDVYALPSPDQTVVMSLGYRAALADVIYAHVLVSYGLHFQEKRLFSTVGDYLETVNRLDPKFVTPYLFADTLLVLQPKTPPVEHYRQARKILLKGTRELPFEPRLWTSAGQYLAYLAPPQLPDKKEREAFRREGARLLTRACELQSLDDNLPFHCIVAASILNKQGRHEANMRFLQRFLAVNDDPEVRAQAIGYLRRAIQAHGQELVEVHAQRFKEAWRAELAFVPPDTALVVGPGFDPVDCVLPVRNRAKSCASSWRDYLQQTQPTP